MGNGFGIGVENAGGMGVGGPEGAGPKGPPMNGDEGTGVDCAVPVCVGGVTRTADVGGLPPDLLSGVAIVRRSIGWVKSRLSRPLSATTGASTLGKGTWTGPEGCFGELAGTMTGVAPGGKWVWACRWLMGCVTSRSSRPRSVAGVAAGGRWVWGGRWLMGWVMSRSSRPRSIVGCAAGGAAGLNSGGR